MCVCEQVMGGGATRTRGSVHAEHISRCRGPHGSQGKGKGRGVGHARFSGRYKTSLRATCLHTVTTTAFVWWLSTQAATGTEVGVLQAVQVHALSWVDSRG